MSKIFVIADTHFNHENIIKYCNRLFKNSYEMNETIIKNWNKVVNENDIIYHLGDFGFGTFDELKNIFNRLNGIKILIMGNHDYRCGIKYYKNIGFKEVYKKVFVLDKYVLTHFPKNVPDGFINIFGHIHDKDIPKEFNGENHICVSVDKTNFYPIELKILKGE